MFKTPDDIPLTAFRAYLLEQGYSKTNAVQRLSDLRAYLRACGQDVTQASLDAWRQDHGSGFGRTWKLFRAYTADSGVDLLMPRDRRRYVQLPEDVEKALAVFFFQLPSTARTAKWSDLDLTGSFVSVFTIRAKRIGNSNAKAAVLTIRKWAYGDAKPVATDLAFPAAPHAAVSISADRIRTACTHYGSYATELSSS